MRFPQKLTTEESDIEQLVMTIILKRTNFVFALDFIEKNCTYFSRFLESFQSQFSELEFGNFDFCNLSSQKFNAITDLASGVKLSYLFQSFSNFAIVLEKTNQSLNLNLSKFHQIKKMKTKLEDLTYIHPIHFTEYLSPNFVELGSFKSVNFSYLLLMKDQRWRVKILKKLYQIAENQSFVFIKELIHELLSVN